jgi:radical SAM superfamily enzyme
MIPYPPVGTALLAGAVDSLDDEVRLIDLEMTIWREHQRHGKVLLYAGHIDVPRVLAQNEDSELGDYEALLVENSEIGAREDVGISVMGFEQLASALLLARAAASKGSRIILGGQFWSESSARQVLGQLQSDAVTVTVGDGWIPLQEWKTNPAEVPSSSFGFAAGEILQGRPAKGALQPPIPLYDSVDWDVYRAYSSDILGDAREMRRAHLYVWDKLCPYKCNFCRVSSGSNAKLNSPETVVASLQHLLAQNVRQFNFMTNELNPTLAYMRRVIRELRPLLSGRDDIGWFTYLRPDHMEMEDLTALREIGCRLVRYGVETGSQRLSDRMEKGYEIGTVARVLRRAAEADIMNHVNFLIGYPGETDEDVEQTIRFIAENHDVIHSVRLNPFYLPPGTRLAKDPAAYGLRLIEFRRGYWDFEMLDGTRPQKAVVKDRIERVTDAVMQYDIGFAGVLPFETLNSLSGYPTRDEGMAALRREHGYLWENASPDWLKARLGGYDMNAEWEETIYKRGRNYNLDVCTD